MDILAKYEKENSQVSSQAPLGESSEEYSGMTRFVTRLSGGRIQDIHQANVVLVIVAVLLFVLSVFFFLRRGGPRLPSVSEILRDTPTTGLRPGAMVPQ
ncbi:MAG: hypothetical protein AAB972_00660 [Patescibacteria group bacterium]